MNAFRLVKPRATIRLMTTARALLLFVLYQCFASNLPAQQSAPPYDLWNNEVIARIRDRSTLQTDIQDNSGFFPGTVSYDVFFVSNPAAEFFDGTPPYAQHAGETIRIHGFLSVPAQGGPYPALVISHGHGGKADLALAQQVAFLGYVALYIDGPQAGQSTGGPHDDYQSWISVDDGPQYGYLYHYGYAGMRALTLLEELASRPGNPYRINPDKLGALGISMGGLITSYLNGIDNRMKAAILIASAGSWPHILRYPNNWLYHALYTGTRDQPYNGSDPPNSVEDIDRDPTALTFLNYFDPIRYAQRQYAPVLAVIGTHDEFFPLPSANLMLLATTGSGVQANFAKRLWLIPNTTHGFETASGLSSLVLGLQQFMEFAMNGRSNPLATPEIILTEAGGALRFEIALDEPSVRLQGARGVLYAATRIDSTITPIGDFLPYEAARQGDRFVVQMSPGQAGSDGQILTSSNVIYYATVTDAGGLPVSSLVYKGSLPMDLSTDFTPVIEGDGPDWTVVPLPPAPPDAAETVLSAIPVKGSGAYQGMVFSNPTEMTKAVRVEARSANGRIAAAEGLINPIYVSLPARKQEVFVQEEWFGPGAARLNGSFHAIWTDTVPATLALRGTSVPSAIDEIGPVGAPAKSLWLPLVPERDTAAERRIRILGGTSDAEATIVFRNTLGSSAQFPQTNVTIPAYGIADISPPPSAGASNPAYADIEASSPVGARLEVSNGWDPWSIEAQPVPGANHYFLPHAEWNGIYTTHLIFVNPSDTTRRIQPRLYRHDGSEVLPEPTLTLDPRSSSNIDVEPLFPGTGGEAGAGWIAFDAPDGPVIIVALAVDSLTGAAAASAVGSGASGLWSLPFYVESAGYWTGLAIANVSDKISDIEITALDRDGNELGHLLDQLEPGQSDTKLVFQWFKGLTAGTSGQITIAASQPAAVLAYFGTDDGRALAAIPLTLVIP